MSKEFQGVYLSLLRRQVDEEIAYLVSNGHNNDKIYVPCMFCVQRKEGHYICFRLNELRQFQSSIISNQTDKLRPEQDRKPISFEVPPVHSENLALNCDLGIKRHNLPLMFPKL